MIQQRWHAAYVGIGSNLESPVDQVNEAIELLRNLPECRVIAVSGLYQSAPLCGRDQPDYVNAVAAMETQQKAHDFLQQLHSLEKLQGRVRTGERWKSRVLDLDLLAYGQQILQDDDLTIPHPGIAERNFVLLPWNEITPEFLVPGLASVAELAARISGNDGNIERLK